MEGLLVLLGAVLLLGSTEGNKNYDELHTSRKGIVDKAIELANNVSGHRKHIDFDSILNSDNNGMVHVLLKPTSCDKKEYVHRRECKTNDLKPWMSCVACSNTMDCVRLRERKPVQCTSQKAGNPVLTGGTHSLFLQGTTERDPEQLTGCLGCI
ncbi:uncharacterized protein si:dkeyp-73d8.6 [Xyrauchen texanus]|uniref:uncharacterized protein si:dkeyp-73d8.6 n=1 Tax=Xyrauchen texanus TaxID=154827 RepID=UPI0022424096|nr:uncharacterized protein si:dkeyp-73d8.6 [Xyrauchen texanus]